MLTFNIVTYTNANPNIYLKRLGRGCKFRKADSRLSFISKLVSAAERDLELGVALLIPVWTSEPSSWVVNTEARKRG